MESFFKWDNKACNNLLYKVWFFNIEIQMHLHYCQCFVVERLGSLLDAPQFELQKKPSAGLDHC